MYINDREHISYHGFIKSLRKKNQASQVSVCKGICTASAMNRFEKGNRMMEKLMRDRFIARLGICCEKYEDYLQPREYALWEQRQRIVKAIETREMKQAKEELDAYALSAKDNCIHLQFVDAMRYMILKLEDTPQEILMDVLRNAIKHTVPDVEKALEGEHLLCDQEINLIAELIGLNEPEDGSADVNAWRKAQYEKLIAYIENSRWEKMQKEKISPKIVHHICQNLQEKEEWSDFCYLYYENECYDMTRVIKFRRQMLGISQEKIAEGICSERSVIRLERESTNCSVEMVRHIFEKMGLCPECRRARVLTYDVEALFLWDEVIRNMNHEDFESWEENLKKLEDSLCMEIPQNKQEVSCLSAVLMYRRGDIGQEEYCRRLKSALEYTFPISAWNGEGEEFLTKSERDIINLLEINGI